MDTTDSKTHVINLGDMLKYIDDRAAGWETYASDGEKRLQFRHAGGYRLLIRGKTTWQGTEASTAVKRYNNAR